MQQSSTFITSIKVTFISKEEYEITHPAGLICVISQLVN